MTVPATLAGAASWTVVEYGLHRFVMHEKRGPHLASRGHLLHHADVTYFGPASTSVLTASAAATMVFPVAQTFAGRRGSVAFLVGLVSTYFGYEIAHRRVHSHAPATNYGQWMRRNHLSHHFGGSMRNHGVTSPVWDFVFGTYRDPGVVTVPSRSAPPWLVDECGAVRPEFAQHYRIRRPTGA